MMTRLVHDRTHLPSPPFIIITPLVNNAPHPHPHILLQQTSPPPPPLPHTPLPPPHLPLIILTATPQPEPQVPLEPAAHVVCVVDPAGGFPCLDIGAGGDGVFVDVGLVERGGEVEGDGDVGEEEGGEVEIVGGEVDGRVNSGGVGAEVGAAEGACGGTVSSGMGFGI